MVFTIRQKNKTIYEISLAYFKETCVYTGIPVAKMSWKLVDWVIQFSSLKGNSKLVAATIASYYNPTKGNCYPSYETIKTNTGLSRSTIQRAIRDMKLSGEWVVLPETRNDGMKYNNYYVPLSPTSPGKDNTGALKPDFPFRNRNNDDGTWVSPYRKNFTTVKEYHKWVKENRNKWESKL